MTEAPLPRGLVKFTLSTQVGGKLQRNVLHFIPPGDATEADLAHLSDLVNRWWFTGSPSNSIDFPNRYVGNSANLLLHELTYISPRFPFNFIVLAIKVAIAAGGCVSDALPGNSTYSKRWRTTSPFRRDSGRLFLPGLCQSAISFGKGGVMDPATSASIQRAYAGLLDGSDPETVKGAGFIPVVWLRSRQTGGVDAMPVVAEIVACELSDPSVKSQILRLPLHSKHDAGAA